MATVPGPRPDRPLPPPGEGVEPTHEPYEEPGFIEPEHGSEPDWLPEPYEPEREAEEEGVALPLGA